MSDNATTVKSSGGVGLFGLLTVLFIGLKLTNYIDWSWWWVLAPMWAPIAIVLALIVLVPIMGLAFVGSASGIAKLLSKRGEK